MIKYMYKICLVALVVFMNSANGQENQNLASLKGKTIKNRWEIDGDQLVWKVEDVHNDRIEMSGLKVSGIITYGSRESGDLFVERKIVWPMLRTIPNNTHASLIHEFKMMPSYLVNGKSISNEHLEKVVLDGTLNLYGTIKEGIELVHSIKPSVDKSVLLESITFTNSSGQKKEIEVVFPNYEYETDKIKGVYGAYVLEARLHGAKAFTLEPNETTEVYLQFSARKKGERYLGVEPNEEAFKRRDFLNEMRESLIFESPNQELNKMFEFAKIRATESIFDTKGGLMHAPGGGSFYAAIWANDQAEYINPFFPFLGNSNGNESAINSFRHFARFMNDEFKPIPSSIIAEGDDFWNGAGDRGDMAMIAYGASRFALAYGDKKTATELFPLIKWCLEYSERQKTKEGIIASDSDELEGRFPSGDANLTTSTLTYGALISSAHLAKELGNSKLVKTYNRRAFNLRKAIDTYFGASMEGFETYRYFDGNKKLRSWISIPLTMGIFEKKEETIKALLSPYLWSENGVYTEAGNETFWDRATLYTLRGIFNAGETATAFEALCKYSKKRLLGDHVPYAVEAWPEGNQQHLSAESALYCRVITEGMFGIEPTGFNKFNCSPRLPEAWDNMALKRIKAFGHTFDIEVIRQGKDKLNVVVKTAEGTIITRQWGEDKEPLEIILP